MMLDPLRELESMLMVECGRECLMTVGTRLGCGGKVSKDVSYNFLLPRKYHLSLIILHSCNQQDQLYIQHGQ